MYTCWDCRRFGVSCNGLIPDHRYKNKVEEYCPKFVVNEWRDQMSKRDGDRRL